MRQLDNEFGRESSDNYENKMTIIKDGEFEKLGQARHELEVKLNEGLLKDKEAEIKDLEDKRAKIKADMLANKDY